MNAADAREMAVAGHTSTETAASFIGAAIARTTAGNVRGVGASDAAAGIAVAHGPRGAVFIDETAVVVVVHRATRNDETEKEQRSWEG
jgi:hypothetical protein